MYSSPAATQCSLRSYCEVQVIGRTSARVQIDHAVSVDAKPEVWMAIVCSGFMTFCFDMPSCRGRLEEQIVRGPDHDFYPDALQYPGASASSGFSVQCAFQLGSFRRSIKTVSSEPAETRTPKTRAHAVKTFLPNWILIEFTYGSY